jgi:MFS family permease
VTRPVPSFDTLQANRGTYAGLFTVTLATLMYEIALTRIFSVTMWYHFAFLAISVALFGMTMGALLVHLLPDRFRDEDVKRHLWRYSLGFGISIALCFVTQLTIPFEPHATVAGIWSVVFTCVVISIPFVFSGVVVCLALTRFPARVNRLYAADLVGAALGGVLLVVVIGRLDGPSTVIATGAIAGVASLCFASDAHSRRGIRLASAAIVVLGGSALLNGHLHHVGNPPLRITWAKEAADPKHDFEKWNVFSRITVDGNPKDPNTKQMGMVIDSTAGTPLIRRGDPVMAADLRSDITNLAHSIRHDGDVLVVGVGGGRDVLSALLFGQRSVTGVEINNNVLHATNGVFGDFTGHLDRDPKVKFVNDEARSYLTRTDRRYDLIQISLIDTWAATASGAFALSENGLYTTHAWNVFFDRLKPNGILSVSRWYRRVGATNQPLEMYRAASLASQVLTERGVANPREHMAIYEGPKLAYGLSVATLLVSPDPFTPADFATLNATAGRLAFTPVLTTTTAIDRVFADLAAPGGPGPAVRAFRANISPPTDNRPFFFQMANFDTLFSKSGRSNDLVFQPVLVLVLLAITVLGLAAVCILLPLLLTTRRSAHKGMAPFYTYFAGIGLGFLLVEVSQLQRLSIFLGHPTYGLTVVLFSVLLFSGMGSMLTERFVRADRPVSLLAPFVVLLGAVVTFGLVTPHVLAHMESSTTPVRIATAIGLLAPLSLVMGMPFAIGMRVAATRPGAPTAFMWGINGATSVCASVFGLVIALFFGIAAAFWTGGVAYALAGAAMAAIALRRRPPTGVIEVQVPERKAHEAPAGVPG